MLKKIRALLKGRGEKPKAGKRSKKAAAPKGPVVVERPIPESDLDPDAVKIVQRLARFDHKAYLVGGCVRDLLLDKHPKDFDIGTSATPRQVRRVFRNCRIIGRRFRLAHIYFQNGKIIEVATFRAKVDTNGAEDADSGDLLIREDNLFGTPESDALRRDFTVNCLFYDVNDDKVIDHGGGLQDLKKRLIRTIGDPDVRFQEDPIRILRAIKFAARLDFKIETKTLKALCRARVEIPKAAPPRILEEISRFGRERAARRSFELLRETEVFQVILPELEKPYRNDNAWKVLFALLEGMDRRREAGHDVSPGEVFAALLLPTMIDHLGWSMDGKAQHPRKLDLRELVDSRMRPIALRLRISRRDQERCRQIIGILFRMVPLANVRPSTRRGLLRRVCFLESLWMLEAMSGLLGSDFSEAFESWKDSKPERGASRRGGAHEEDDEDGDEDEERPRSRRRGRRRGGRGRGRKTDEDRDSRPQSARSSRSESKPQAKQEPRARTKSRPKPDGKSSTKPDAPKKWDDDYFFAALPSAPKMSGEDAGGDRYGADSVADPVETPPANGPETQDSRDSQASGDSEGAAPPRRRRRRRRRRGSGRGAASGDDASKAETSGADDSGSDEAANKGSADE